MASALYCQDAATPMGFTIFGMNHTLLLARP